MYFGVLVTCAGCVVFWPLWWKVATWLAAAVLLVLKAHREEVGLVAQFPEYDAYRRSRRFLVPGLW
jgi:protein-S-isoprenylcysteine O-methyltransferase Ste14